jgi:hypothetical protein
LAGAAEDDQSLLAEPFFKKERPGMPVAPFLAPTVSRVSGRLFDPFGALSVATRFSSGEFDASTTDLDLAAIAGVNISDWGRAQLILPYHYVNQNLTGLGDLRLIGSLQVLNERDFIPAVFLVGLVKFPTADGAKFSAVGPGGTLVTGELDLGGGVEIEKSVESVIIRVAGGFTEVGSPPGGNLRNSFSYRLEMNYPQRIQEGENEARLDFSMALEGATAVNPATNAPVYLIFSLLHTTRHFSFGPTAAFGLKPGTPNLQFDLGLAYTF